MRLIFNPLTGKFDFVGDGSSSNLSVPGVVVWDDGVFVATGIILDFGDDLKASRSGTVVRVDSTGTTLNLAIDGTRLFPYIASGSFLVISNSPDPQEVIGVYGQNEGIPLGTGLVLNFVGDNVDASLSGTVLRVFVTGTAQQPFPPFPQEIIGFMGQDEGVPLGTGATLNVIGSNIALSLSGTVLQITHTDTPVIFPVELIGVYGKDEGQNVGTGTILNVVGPNISLSLSGTTLTLLHADTPVTFPPPVFGIAGQEEGVALGTGTTLNVRGGRSLLSISGTVLQLDISPDPQELIGIYGQDEGINVGTGTILNVTGPNISLSLSGSVLNIDHTNPVISFPPESIGVFGQEEGVSLGTGTTLNVRGSRSLLSISGTVLQLDISPDPIELIGVMGQDEGVPLGTGTFLNVVGENISLSLSGTTLTLLHTEPSVPVVFPQDNIGIMGWDEGAPLGTGTILNVVGSRLTASLSGTVLQIASSPDPVDNIGVMFQNEGVPLGTGTTLNVIGSVTVSGSVTELRAQKQLVLCAPANAGGTVITNLAAADTTYGVLLVDLAGYTQCRLTGVFGATAPATASGTIVHLMYATGLSLATPSTELALNKDSEEGRLRWVASQQKSTNWFTIQTNAAVDQVGLYLRITGGNGTADPNLFGLLAEFR